MTVAVIVICPADIRESAVEWGGAGLIADSYWVSAADAALLDHDHPNALQVHRIAPGDTYLSAPLLVALSDLRSLDEVRVAWIRRSEEQLNDSMKSLEMLLRQALPSDKTRWLDVIAPTRRTDHTMVQLPGQWTQLRVIPEDRSAPDVTDAGWDLDLDVALHAALAALGILAGTFGNLPWGRTSAADHYDVRVFSRIVLGALNTDAEVRRFIGRTMPDASAGSFFPRSYLEVEPEQSVALVNDAIDHILALDSGALDYRDPPPSTLAPPPRLTAWEHLRLVFRFLGYCLPLLFGIRRRSTVVVSRFNFTDAGYDIGTEKVLAPRGLKPADFDALDAHAAAEARKKLDEFEATLRRKPPASIASTWRTLYQLTTSINDGGQTPDGWNPPEQHKRRPVVAGRWVRPDPAGTVSSSIPELAGARSIAVAAAAVTEARRRRNPSLAALPNRTGSVATANELVTEGNSRDTERLSRQIDDLDVPTGQQPSNFLDRLAGRLHGGSLRARLDAERWRKFATDPSPKDPLDWNAAERKFRLRTLIGLGATAGLTAVWAVVSYFARAHLPSWLSLPIGFATIGVVGGGFALWSFYAFYVVFTASMERGRRRLELRAAWLTRACRALEETARLAPARRIFGRWVDILAAIFPYDEQSGALPHRAMPSKAPKCMTVALPVYTDREMTKWLAEEGAEAGWRIRALEAMAANAFEEPAADALKRLVEDNGVKGGPLHDMWERRDTLWTDYAATLRHRSTGNVASRMVESGDRGVTVISPVSGRPGHTPLKSFGSEPWPAPEDDDVRVWDESRDFRVYASLQRSEQEVRHNPDTCLLAVRLQLKRHDVDPAEEPNKPKESRPGKW